MLHRHGSVAYRMWLFNQFHECVRREVVPAIHADLGGQQLPVVVAGASIGAYNALGVLCRYPEAFRAAVCMSGTYEVQRFLEHALRARTSTSPRRCSSCPGSTGRSSTRCAGGSP